MELRSLDDLETPVILPSPWPANAYFSYTAGYPINSEEHTKMWMRAGSLQRTAVQQINLNINPGKGVPVGGGSKQGRFVILRFPLFYSVWGSKDTKMLRRTARRMSLSHPFLCAPQMLVETRI